MQKFILAIDEGTTGITTLLVDEKLRLHGKVNVELPQHFPEPSFVEHDLKEIWRGVESAVSQTLALAKAEPSQIAAIGITNQRETTCLWNRKTGEPMGRAVVWQDRRTAAECARLKKAGYEKQIRKKTGLCLDPYFSATKLAWLLKNVPGCRAQAEKGEVVFGTIDSFLLFRLTGGVHATDVSNASRTLLMDLKTCDWDAELLKMFRIPSAMLPQIQPSAVEYGRTKGFLHFPDGIPITGLVGDQQAALFGQACFEKGGTKATYGTGAFVLLNTGSKLLYSKHGLLTTVAWKLGSEVTYAFEGSAFIAGAAVQWFRDGLGAIQKSSEIETLARSVPDSDGLLFVPALTGMGAPYWLPNATGLITGITRRTTKAHLAVATLEGMALQVGELLQAMAQDYGHKIPQLKVDGGASANGLLMQMQANLLGVPVVRSSILETTALGAALQAGLGVGFWEDLDQIKGLWKAGATFQSEISTKERNARFQKWRTVVKAVQELSQKIA